MRKEKSQWIKVVRKDMIDIDRTKITLVTFEIFVIMINTKYCVYVSTSNKWRLYYG